METKVVKFEIGKLLALVIAIVVIASVAGVILQSNYFQGNIRGGKEVQDTNPLPPKQLDFFSRIDLFKTNIEKGLDYGKELDMLKQDFDLMISEKLIGAGVAKETIEALSVMQDIDTDKVIEAIEVSIPAYQKTSDFAGFSTEIANRSIELIQPDDSKLKLK